jgi:hypothetical protein
VLLEGPSVVFEDTAFLPVELDLDAAAVDLESPVFEAAVGEDEERSDADSSFLELSCRL